MQKSTAFSRFFVSECRIKNGFHSSDSNPRSLRRSFFCLNPYKNDLTFNLTQLMFEFVDIFLFLFRNLARHRRDFPLLHRLRRDDRRLLLERGFRHRGGVLGLDHRQRLDHPLRQLRHRGKKRNQMPLRILQRLPGKILNSFCVGNIVINLHS